MLGLAVLAQISVSIIVQGTPLLAPIVQADLGLTRAEVGFFNSALMGGSLVMMLTAGAMVDSRGERLALIGGTFMVGVFAIAVLGTQQFHAALLVLFMAGIGGAFPTPAGSKAVMGWFPPHLRGTAMGIRQTGIPLGGAIAAAVLPPLALAVGWRMALALGGVACFLAAAACWLGYRNPEAPAAGGGASVVAEPARDVGRRVLALGLAGGLLTLGQFTLITYLSLYLTETRQLAVTVCAALLFGAQIAGALGRILWGVASDRLFGRRRKPALLLANGLSVLGALAIGWLPQATPLWAIALLVVFHAFNTLGWHGTWVSMIVEIGGPTRQGRTVSQGMALMYPSIICLPPLFGWFVDHTHSWQGVWTLLAGVLLLGVGMIALVREGHGVGG